ncbi:MAG: DUF177 domain-containing protein [Candidatus Limnocylindrales bacterium]
MLRYNVADLLRSAPGTSERHDVSATSLSMPEGVELVEPVEGEVRLTFTGRSILATGAVRTALAEQCSRCLRAAKAIVNAEFEEEALPSVDVDSGSPIADDEGPEVLRVSDHHELDLEPVVRDAISLAEPIAPLCRPDCPGLCETCGLDLIENPGHAHADDEIDPRLAALAGIREQLN